MLRCLLWFTKEVSLTTDSDSVSTSTWAGASVSTRVQWYLINKYAMNELQMTWDDTLIVQIINLIILGWNIILIDSWHHNEANKIYFTLFWVICNFIWIIQDETCKCIKTEKLIGLLLRITTVLRTVCAWGPDRPPVKFETGSRKGLVLCNCQKMYCGPSAVQRLIGFQKHTVF